MGESREGGVYATKYVYLLVHYSGGLVRAGERELVVQCKMRDWLLLGTVYIHY